MSMATVSLSSSHLLHVHPHLGPKTSLHRHLCISSTSNKGTLRLFSTPRRRNLNHGFDFPDNKNPGFAALGENRGGQEAGDVRMEEDWRGESTMPDRFRYLTKTIPDPPVRWPWFLAGGLAVLLYGSTWRAVLWELGNWRKAFKAIVNFMGQVLNFSAAVIYYYFGDIIDTALYALRSFYSGIVTSAPVPELITIILLTSAVLSIAETTVPDSVNRQQRLLTVSGIIGYAAVRSFISEPFFWTLLLAMFGFARFVKKRDYVSSALPVAAVLASVGEPWVRAVTLISFTALAIVYHSKHRPKEEEEVERTVTVRKLPLPLVGIAVAIGMRVATQWAGYRHLTWMIV